MVDVPASLAIVTGDFHQDIADTMCAAAEAAARAAGITDIRVIRVAGSYEVPLVIDTVLANVDAAVVLGYIERGETLHGEVMGQVVHHTLLQLQLKHRKPIGIGIIGPGATREQAERRQEDYARAAVAAVIRSHQVLASLTK